MRKWFSEYLVIILCILALVLLFGSIAWYIVAAQEFTFNCNSRGGTVKSIFIGYATIIGAKGQITLIPNYSHECILS